MEPWWNATGNCSSSDSHGGIYVSLFSGAVMEAYVCFSIFTKSQLLFQKTLMWIIQNM